MQTKSNCLLVSVMLLVAVQGLCGEPASMPVAFDSPGKGLLSLGVYDESGTLVRSLSYAKEVEAGKQALAWDVTTDLGLPAAPGSYSVRGVWFPGPPKIDFKMKVGVSGDPPYVLDNGLGGWGGNLGPPMDVCSNGKQVMIAFGCVESHNETGLQLMDSTGKILRRYFSFFPWDVRFACTMDEQNIYLALADIGKKRLVVAKYDINNSRGKVLGDVPTGNTVTTEGYWKDRWTCEVYGLALDAGRIYVPVFYDNKLVIMDSGSGAVLGSSDIPSPRGVRGFGGSIFVLSGDKLLKLDRDGKVLGTVIEAGLEDPHGLAIDQQGNFFISDGGSSQQVKVFSPGGKPLRTIGAKPKPGSVFFDAKGMSGARGICLGPDNTLWVAQSDSFQRTSVWDARTGTLVREFFNTRISSGQGMIDTDRMEMLFRDGVFADVPGMTAYKIDPARGTWYPSWSRLMPLSVTSQNDVFLGNTHYHGTTAYGGRHPYLAWTDGIMKADNGKLYSFGGEFSVWLVDTKTMDHKLAAFVYTHRAHKTNDGVFEGDYDQGPNNWFAWSDRNGDGKMAKDECVFTEKHPLMEKCSRLFSWRLQKDLSILMLCPENVSPLKWHVRRLPAREVLPTGVPVYDWADLQEVITLDMPSLAGGDGWKDPVRGAFLTGLMPAGDSYYAFAEPIGSVPIKLGGIDGDGWWASRNWRQTPQRFDAKTGKPEWLKLGRRAPGKAKPGEMYFPRSICAAFDGFVFVPDTISQIWVWTDTGLYVGKLYHDPNDGIRDADSVFIELVGAFVYKIGGKVYSCAGDHGVSVHEVTLPKLKTIDAGKLTVTAELSAAARPWDPDGPVPGKRPIYTARAIYEFDRQQNKNVSLRTVDVDGNLDEWAGVPAAEIQLDGQLLGTLRMVFDTENLYLAYDVKEPNGPRNAGSELPACPFVSGSYVDFCVGRDWTNPDRERNAEGDVRVIMARITGDAPIDYQMAFWPLRKNGKNPQTIASPAAKREFADISPVQALKFACRQTPEGYTLEASVPFKSIELNPVRNSVVGFDASIGIADAGGKVRLRAAHWAGQSESAVVDRPGSSALLPGTWGTLMLDRTPLK